MHLEPEQLSVLHGEAGQAMASALSTLVRFGEVFGARRLVPVKSAHLVGSFGIVFFEGYFGVLDRLADEGARFAVPTTVNPRPGAEHSIINRVAFAKQKRLDAVLTRLGVIPNYSCVFYDHDNIPSRGDRVAWAESSAVVYANSVIGARSNLTSLGIDFCSAVTGLTPEFGYLLDENRRGRVLVKLRVDRMDTCALGFVIGQRVVNRVPVIEHYPFTRTELKNLGAALASAGKVGLFHVEGVTPEAPDLKSVFDDGPEETVVVTQSDLDALRAPRDRPPDLVVFGCPQLDFDETVALCERFAGRRVRRPTWVFMVPAALERLRTTGTWAVAEAAGLKLAPWCPLACLSARIGLGRILAPSAKLRYYLRGAELGTLDDCLAASGGAR
ncbi:MAG: DUF521 domain-containing protein [Candidatus Riflebacteria bacterium]|nr:DUF521 domain-containing protein [Candidatus Riflebacteria bacterium]